MRLGFRKSKVDSNLFHKFEGDGLRIFILYVDDLLFIGEVSPINECKKKLAPEFEMKDLGMMEYFLGLEVWKYRGEIFLNQEKYAIEILKSNGMIYCKAMNTMMTTNLKLLNDDT